MPLVACKTTANNSTGLYKYRAWPQTSAPLVYQSEVAEYIVEGKAAYDSCAATVDLTAPFNE